MVGVGMVGTETCVTKGDLVCPERPDSLWTGTGVARETKDTGAFEESERLIVATTYGESRKQ